MQLILANRSLLKSFNNEINELSQKEKLFRQEHNKWTGEKRIRMYDNVLRFPDGIDHLDYFEKNPHEDNISDKEATLYQLFNQPGAKRESVIGKIDFDYVRNLLYPDLSAFERKLLSLPDILQEEIDAGGEKGYLDTLIHLNDCFQRYFSTPTDKNVLPGIQWINFPFILDYYPAQKALAELRSNLFNTTAVTNLANKLREAGAFGDKKQDFYLWNTSPYNWDAMSYQSRSVEWWSFPFMGTLFKRLFFRFSDLFKVEKLIMPSDLLPDQYGALGNFTINALPEGYVQPKGNDKYDICVRKMYYFINDSFNFEGWEALGFWGLKDSSSGQTKDSLMSLLLNSSLLFNSSFRGFKRHGYGREFPVLSKLHEVEDFEPVCLPYTYAK